MPIEKNACYKKNNNERIVKLSNKSFPKWGLRRRSENVFTEFQSVFFDFQLVKSYIMLFVFHKNNEYSAKIIKLLEIMDEFMQECSF